MQTWEVLPQWQVDGVKGQQKKKESNMLIHFWVEEAIWTDGKHDVNVEKPKL